MEILENLRTASLQNLQ